MLRLGLLLASLTLSPVFAQTGPESAAWSAGGPSSDTGAAVATDWSGNVAVAGTFTGTATFGSISVTDPATGCVFSSCHDVYVVLYDQYGTAQWARRMGTPIHNDFAGGVAISESGHVYVSGYFTGVSTWEGGSNPDIELTTRSDWDAFVAKYTLNGDLLWVARAGGTDQDTGRGIAVDLEGNVYWTGYFYGTATFGEGDEAVTFSSQGSSDGFAARLNADGSLAWAVQVAGIGGSDLYDAVVPSFGGRQLYVAGTFAEVATLGTAALQSRGSNDVIVAALDTEDGSTIWAEQIGGSGSDHGRGIAYGEHFSPEVYVAGWFENQILVGSDVLTTAGQTDALLAAFSHQGDPLWGRRAGGNGFDIAESVAVTEPPPIPVRGLEFVPSVLLTGFVSGAANFSAPTGDVAVTAQGQDGFLAAYGAFEHEVRSVQLLGGPNNDSGRDVAATPSWWNTPPPEQGAFGLYAVVGGTFSGTADVLGETVTSAGSGDAFVGKLATCPDLFCYFVANEGEPSDRGLRLTVTPHPATENARLGVELDAPGDLSVEVVDVRGRVVARLTEGPHAAGDHTFVLPSLPSGTYLLRARTDAGTASRTFVVAR